MLGNSKRRFVINDMYDGESEDFQVESLEQAREKVLAWAIRKNYDDEILNSGDIVVYEIAAEFSIFTERSFSLELRAL